MDGVSKGWELKPMKMFGIRLLLILAPVTVFGEVPESILGTWHFDVVRTMSEHIDRVARARPDVISAEAAETQKAAFSELAEQSNPQATITITEDRIFSANTSTMRPYKVIGGNSRLVIVESTDEEGYDSVVYIRLVEGGIAFETTNCRLNPEQCEREKRRAMEQLRKRQQMDFVAADGSDSVIVTESGEPKLDGLRPSLPRDDWSQPKWVYFEKANDE